MTRQGTNPSEREKRVFEVRKLIKMKERTSVKRESEKKKDNINGEVMILWVRNLMVAAPVGLEHQRHQEVSKASRLPPARPWCAKSFLSVASTLGFRGRWCPISGSWCWLPGWVFGVVDAPPEVLGVDFLSGFPGSISSLCCRYWFPALVLGIIFRLWFPVFTPRLGAVRSFPFFLQDVDNEPTHLALIPSLPTPVYFWPWFLALIISRDTDD